MAFNQKEIFLSIIYCFTWIASRTSDKMLCFWSMLAVAQMEEQEAN